MLGAVLWLFSGLFRGVTTWLAIALVSALGAVLLLRDLNVLRFELPERRRQVPQDVFYSGSVQAAVRFGLELGVGFRTRLTTGAPYFMFASVLLGLSTLPSILPVGAAFGAGRALMPIFRYASRSAEGWDLRLERSLTWIQPTSSAACALIVLIAMLS